MQSSAGFFVRLRLENTHKVGFFSLGPFLFWFSGVKFRKSLYHDIFLNMLRLRSFGSVISSWTFMVIVEETWFQIRSFVERCLW